MQAILALEDGRVFRGKGYGAKGECSGEVVCARTYPAFSLGPLSSEKTVLNSHSGPPLFQSPLFPQ